MTMPTIVAGSPEADLSYTDTEPMPSMLEKGSKFILDIFQVQANSALRNGFLNIFDSYVADSIITINKGDKVETVTAVRHGRATWVLTKTVDLETGAQVRSVMPTNRNHESLQRAISVIEDNNGNLYGEVHVAPQQDLQPLLRPFDTEGLDEAFLVSVGSMLSHQSVEIAA